MSGLEDVVALHDTIWLDWTVDGSGWSCLLRLASSVVEMRRWLWRLSRALLYIPPGYVIGLIWSSVYEFCRCGFTTRRKKNENSC